MNAEIISNIVKASVVIGAVVVTEIIKKYVFKDDKKYILAYTAIPVVLCGLAFLVIALIQKTDVWEAVMAGGSLGLSVMGSYDILVAIIKTWKNKTPTELVKEVSEVINK